MTVNFPTNQREQGVTAQVKMGCDIADPYQFIGWIPPEGGGGPQNDVL